MSYLKEYRLRAGLNQEQLAKRLNVSQACVSRWEHGKAYPEIDTAKQISILLHMPFHLIFNYISPIGSFSIPVYESVNRDGQGRLWHGDIPHITVAEEDVLRYLPAENLMHPVPSESNNFIGYLCRSTALSPHVMPNSVNIIYRTSIVHPNRIHLASINNQDCILVRLQTDNRNHVILSDNIDLPPRCFHPTEVRKGVLRIFGMVVETRLALGY
ncbi:MAG: helix-turn-helix transcriptional regulator [Clostridiales bacterium]|nr:helix-turn-helix transcriptional regulator [Clostridiales bacterium]